MGQVRNNRWSGMEALESRQLLAAVFWDGEAGDLSWHNPLNWSGDVLPGPQDDVSISAEWETIRHDLNVQSQVRNLQITEGRLHLSAGVLEVAEVFSVSFAAGLTMSGGSLAGPGDVLLGGPLQWSGGTMEGAGRLRIVGQGSLRINGDVTLARNVINNGRIYWDSGDVELRSANIYNLPNRVFLIESRGTMISAQGENWIINGGTIRHMKVGTTRIQANLNNQAGARSSAPGLAEGPGPGWVRVSAGALLFEGMVHQLQGTTLRGGRWVVENDGTLILPGPILSVTSATGDYTTIGLIGAGARFPQLRPVQSIDRLELWDHDLDLPQLQSLGELRLGGDVAASRPILAERIIVKHNHSAAPGGYSLPIPWKLPKLTLGEVRAGSMEIEDAASVPLISPPGRMSVQLLLADSLELHSSMIMSGDVRVKNITGGGGIQVAHSLDLRSEVISGWWVMMVGQTVISGGGIYIPDGSTLRLFTADQGQMRIDRRVVNYGTIHWQGQGTLVPAQELVNRGTLRLSSDGFVNTRVGLAPAISPALIHNYGTTIKDGHGTVTLRAAGGGVRFLNRGGVDIQSGRLNLFGGVNSVRDLPLSTPDWTVAPGSELAIGGLPATLQNARIDALGLVRIGTHLQWNSSVITGGGHLYIGPIGHLDISGPGNVLGRSGTTNTGAITLRQHSAASFTGELISTGLIDLGGNLALQRLFLGGDSLLRIRSFAPGSHGYLSTSGPTNLSGTLAPDIAWQPPIPFSFTVLQTHGWSGNFHSLHASGIPAGTSVLFTPETVAGFVFGRIHIVPA